MILILSFDSYEQGTDPVIDWLLYYKADFIKVSLKSLLANDHRYQLDLVGGDLKVDGISVKDEVQVIWNRRFLGEGYLPEIDHPDAGQLKKELHSEVVALYHYLCKLFKDKLWVPHYKGLQYTNLEVLGEAVKCGLNVPESLILNNKTDLKRFVSKHQERVITKPFSELSRWYYHDQEHTYYSLTKRVGQKEVAELPAFFFPSLFQQQISHEVELRVFYLFGQCYSTAIINRNAKGLSDRKLYNVSDQTHMVPFELPEVLKEQIGAFMEQVDLSTGCIDLLLNEEGKYYFLEVNPVGQYLAESEFCGYRLEKVIAECLIEKAKICKITE